MDDAMIGTGDVVTFKIAGSAMRTGVVLDAFFEDDEQQLEIGYSVDGRDHVTYKAASKVSL